MWWRGGCGQVSGGSGREEKGPSAQEAAEEAAEEEGVDNFE
mgnify:CR=1 FL=1